MTVDFLICDEIVCIDKHQIFMILSLLGVLSKRRSLVYTHTISISGYISLIKRIPSTFEVYVSTSLLSEDVYLPSQGFDLGIEHKIDFLSIFHKF